MSEEQPTFKVKDRRLFNPDGTPREIERGEEASNAESAAKETTPTPAAGASDAAARTAGSVVASSSSSAASASGSVAGTSERSSSASSAAAQASAHDETVVQTTSEGALAEEEFNAEEEIPGADDPTSFINFLMSIASNAAASLGMMEHPVTGQRGVDLPLAKHWIDVLGMLQQKTRGNLAAQEEQIFQGLLADLRMQYISLTSAPPSSSTQGRGFTGRDIIGGK